MKKTSSPRLKALAGISAALATIAIANAAPVNVTATFTMYDDTGVVVGVDTGVSAFYDVEARTWGVASTTPFFGARWTASGGVLYAPGTYTVNINGDGSDECTYEPSTCNAPQANGDGNYTFTVPVGTYGGNINFAWRTNTGIDVFMAWANNGQDSVDLDSDTLPGARMVDGAFPGYSANFTFSFTNAPVPFSFPPAGDQPTGIIVQSNPIPLYVLGWSNPLPASVTNTGGATASEFQYSVDGGNTYSGWMTTGSIPVPTGSNQAYLQVRHTASNTDGETNGTTLTVGVIGSRLSADFTSRSVTVIVPDSCPDNFTFAPKTNQPRTTPVESGAYIVEGINKASLISASGGDYLVSVDGGSTWTVNTPATVEFGDQVKARHTSASSFNASISSTVTIGDVADCSPVTATFTSMTEAEDPNPPPFTLGTKLNVPVSTLVESDPFTVGGINTNAPISVSGAADSAYAISTDNGATYGNWTRNPGTVANLNKVKVRHTSSSAFATQTDTVLTIGSVSGTFSSVTLSSSTISSSNNNFTMFDDLRGLTGGTNDVTFAWDGSLNTDPATAVVNASLASAGPTPFFGQNWTAYDIKIYGPGTYRLSTQDTPGGPGCPFPGKECVSGAGNNADYTVTVGSDQIMAHMKFAWSATQGIDVVNVWQTGNWNTLNAGNPIWTSAGGSYSGSTFDYVSVDWDNDGLPGGKMIDGPFQGYSANFSVRRVTGTGGGPVQRTPQQEQVPDSNKMPGCSVSSRPVDPLERGDWWLVAGFIGWLAWLRRRAQRQSLH